MFGSLAEKLFGQSRYSRYALIISLFQAFIVTLLESLILAVHTRAVNEIPNTPKLMPVFAQGRSLTIYHVISIISQFFQLAICTDAIYHQNTIQLIALSIFIFCCFGFSCIQLYQSAGGIFDVLKQDHLPKDAIPFEIAVIVMMFGFSLCFAYLGYKLYQEFGWTIYKKIGADMEMRDRYKMYQIFIVLLKFNIFFIFGFSVQFLSLLVILNDKGEILQHIIFSLVTSIVVIVVGYWGVQSEKKILMYIFMIGCLVGEGYLIWRLVEVTQNDNNKYIGAKIWISFFLYVCLVLTLVTFIISIRCLRNFDKGLIYHFSRGTNITSQVNGGDGFIGNNRAYSLETVNRHTQRWSID